VVQFTTFLVHSQGFSKFMSYRKRELPRSFLVAAYAPIMLLVVNRLVQEPLLMEVQAIAVL
jgi:hypothetical protein